MRSEIGLGRILGISIRIHLSWFIIFGLVTWALAENYFPTTYPGWSAALTITVSLVTSLLFFVSVLAHELMHSLVAKRYGIPVSTITLFILGGIAHIAEEPKKPRVEFLVAIAGPLTNITIGVVCGVAWLALPMSAEIAVAVSFWLAWINLMLGVFNLVPGFPMDGGRVIRAWLWWRSGNLDQATRTASGIGKTVGLLFIIGGVFLIFYGMFLNGLWIAIIGLFIRNAAASSYRQLSFGQIFKGRKVKDVMSDDCIFVDMDMDLEKLVGEYIFTSRQRCFAVSSAGSLKGLVTMRDIKAVPENKWQSTKVGDVMTPLDKVQSVGPEDELTRVFILMNSGNVNQLPVLADGHLAGMITRNNLLAFINFRQSSASSN